MDKNGINLHQNTATTTTVDHSLKENAQMDGLLLKIITTKEALSGKESGKVFPNLVWNLHLDQFKKMTMFSMSLIKTGLQGILNVLNISLQIWMLSHICLLKNQRHSTMKIRKFHGLLLQENAQPKVIH